MTIVNCTLLAEVDMIYASVVGLIALIVLVFAILSAKNWHWVNVVLLIFTLIASITSIVGMTYAYKHRRDGMLVFAQQEKRALTAEAKVEEIISGDPLSIKYDRGSLRDSNNRLALVMTGRGHAWSGGTVSTDGELAKFTLKNERNFKDEAEKNSLVGAILYAFAENKNGIPANYIGSVSVEGATPADFTLKPVDLIDAKRFENPQTPWTLFEKMPQDKRGIFKAALISSVSSQKGHSDTPAAKQRDAFVKILQESKENNKALIEINIAEFTKILKRDYLPANQLGYSADSLEYEKLIDQYAFDGQSIGKIEKYIESAAGRKDTVFEPTPEEVFIKFSFTADSDNAVRTDSKDDNGRTIGSLENDGIYNTNGETVVGKLMKNPEGVTFKTNDVVLIDAPSATTFENSHQGKLKQIDRVYVRQLQDFPLMFKNMRIRAARFVDESITAQATTAKTEVALNDAKKQIDVRTDLISKSTEDEERFQRDAENLVRTNQTLEQRSAELEEQIKNRQTRIDWQYQQIQSQTLERVRSAVSISQ